MSEDKAKFQIHCNKIGSKDWSICLGISHADYGKCKETYLYINLVKWSIAIGYMGGMK